MEKLEIYLGKKLLLATIVVLLVVLSLDFLISFISELEDVKYHYTAYRAAIYVLLNITRHIEEFMPVAALTGCLSGLGAIAADNELIAMRSLGISNLQIFKMISKALIIIILFSMLVSEFVAPYAVRKAEINKKILVNSKSSKILTGLWRKDDNEFININSLELNGKVNGISRFIFSKDMRLQELILASYAQIVEGKHWILTNVEKYIINYNSTGESTGYIKEYYDSLVWDISLSTKILQTALISPDFLSIMELINYNKYLQQESIQSQEYQLSLWKKLLQPLVILVLIFASMQVISGNMRMVNLGIRIVLGIVFGSAFIILQKTMGSLSLVLNIHPIFCLLLPLILCLIGSIIYSWHIRG
jgi:lipopolysaccharide export system permease protein